MRSTAPRRRPSPACSSACRSGWSPSTSTRTNSLAPFLVFATQNPVEYEGTYPLPEAQVDRFMVRLEARLPSAAEEARMLAGHQGGDRVLELRPVADRAQVLEAQDAARRCTPPRRCATTSSRCCTTRARTTGVELGASPRAGLMLLRAAKARALLQGRDHALPDDVQALATIVLRTGSCSGPEAAGVGRPTSSPTRLRRRRRSEEPGVRSALGCRDAGPVAAARRRHVRRRAALRHRLRAAAAGRRCGAVGSGPARWARPSSASSTSAASSRSSP